MHYLLTSQWSGEDTEFIATSTDLPKLQAFAAEWENDLNHVIPWNLQEGQVAAVPDFTEETYTDARGPHSVYVWQADDTEYRISEIFSV